MAESTNLDSSNVVEDSVKMRIARYDEYYDARTFSTVLRKTSKPKKTKDRKHALVVRRIIDYRGRYTHTLIDIRSPNLLNVLLEINKGVENITLHLAQASPQVMYYSYAQLCNRLDDEKAKQPRDDALLADLMAAIHVVEEDQGKALQDMETLSSRSEITFELLWALFTPNVLIFNYHDLTEQDRLLLVRKVDYEKRQDESLYLDIACDIIHDRGDSFGLARQHLEINDFRGVRPITDLDAYPLKYHVEKDKIYARAVKLGKIYAQLPLHSYQEINGQAMRNAPAIRDGSATPEELTMLDGSNRIYEKFHSSGRVMISSLAHHRFDPNITYSPPIHRQLQKDSLTEDQFAICSPILLGFAFDRKSWGGFAISRMKDVVWNDAAFDSLVLGKKQKTLIRGLVQQHATHIDSGFDDIIKGKGQGLIGLLAGTPGCGKTLTAEAVAEVMHKPLYSVSAGELGTTPESVEIKLLRALELAQMWGAVILLDEAEVFLQQRTRSDINRNALVSIFLRQLEYYQGIMILTTNMAEQGDTAFESRIHFSVYYPELDQVARKQIWETFFTKCSLNVNEADLDRLAQHRINGRQIKNAFSSAQTISLSRGSSCLSIEDVEVVLSVLQDWQRATRRKNSAPVEHAAQ